MTLPSVLLLFLGAAMVSSASVLSPQKYEWSKHGTCAAQEEIMNSQHKYFSKGLELYHKVDLDSVLKKLNITPSAQYYNEKDSQTLAQIEICFNHDMTFLNCEKESVGKGVTRPSALGVCDHNIPVYYPPLSLSVQ
ncbi:unnamed protein product [Merluccius merluccius]